MRFTSMSGTRECWNASSVLPQRKRLVASACSAWSRMSTCAERLSEAITDCDLLSTSESAAFSRASALLRVAE
jgi:hypothetical protein